MHEQSCIDSYIEKYSGLKTAATYEALRRGVVRIGKSPKAVFTGGDPKNIISYSTKVRDVRPAGIQFSGGTPRTALPLSVMHEGFERGSMKIKSVRVAEKSGNRSVAARTTGHSSPGYVLLREHNLVTTVPALKASQKTSGAKRDFYKSLDLNTAIRKSSGQLKTVERVAKKHYPDFIYGSSKRLNRREIDFLQPKIDEAFERSGSGYFRGIASEIKSRISVRKTEKLAKKRGFSFDRDDAFINKKIAWARHVGNNPRMYKNKKHHESAKKVLDVAKGYGL